jgi:hypothetical protein
MCFGRVLGPAQSCVFIGDRPSEKASNLIGAIILSLRNHDGKRARQTNKEEPGRCRLYDMAEAVAWIIIKSQDAKSEPSHK